MRRGEGFSQDEKCYACARPFGGRRHDYPTALTIDGQRQFVGNDCMKKIVKAGAEGYQPPLGGPRLFDSMQAPAEVLAAAGITIIRKEGK